MLTASEFAGPLFGFNPKHLSDQDLINLLDRYRLIRSCKQSAYTGPGGPGDLAWVWPLTSFLLLLLILRRRRKK
ncbi:MAG: hypothetical protein JSV42_02185 [Chloroflexota bacterium]|nr:MAG: hypothetical protein JSV42_02185 [Chloroflexota bacterium]